MTDTATVNFTETDREEIEKFRALISDMPDFLKSSIRFDMALLLMAGVSPREAVEAVAESQAQNCLDEGMGEEVANVARTGTKAFCLVDIFDTLDGNDLS